MAQVVEQLAIKHKVLSSNPSIAKTIKKLKIKSQQIMKKKNLSLDENLMKSILKRKEKCCRSG
jgi:hypothetical protein